MNATQFLELLKKADQLEKANYLVLKKVQKNFPYFYLSHALATRFENKTQDQETPPSLRLAALTSPDRVWLKHWLRSPSQPLDILTEVEKEEKPKQKEAKAAPTPTVGTVTTRHKPKKRIAPQEDLIESLKRKEKKEILDSKKQEQRDLIKAFSKKEIKLATIKEIEANQNTENLAAASTSLNDQALSETFAKILLQQSKKALAIEIYEKLALKFPEKRAYFADLIEKTKE